MYISVGLILIYCINLIQVNGILKQCYAGGLSDYGCYKLIKESVLERYLICNYGTTADSHEQFDVPYNRYFVINSEKSLHKYVRLFYMKPNISIAAYWEDVLSTGTDLHRIKFHNKLANMLYNDSYPMSYENMMVFIKSCYNAASTYYFIKKTEIALKVIREGQEIIKFAKDNSEVDMKEVIVWLILYHTLEINILESEYSPTYNGLDRIINVLNEDRLELDNLIQTSSDKKYPSAYILLFRGYFLNTDVNDNLNLYLNYIIQNNLIAFEDNDPDYKLFCIYQDLVLSRFVHSENETKAFSKLMDAIKRPILSIEDRLLNYITIQLIMDRIEICLQNNLWTFENNEEFCQSIYTYFCNDQDFQRIVYNIQLRNLYPYAIEELNNYIAIEYDNFNWNIVHAIVSSVIDLNMTDYEEKINIVKEAIGLLEDYISTQKETQLKIYNNNGNYNSLLDLNDISPQNSNIYNAYKWLTELNAILCTDKLKDDELLKCQKQIKINLKEAEKLGYAYNSNRVRIFPDDDHLKFLMYKIDCKFSQLYQSWEIKNKVDGWNLTEPLKAINIKKYFPLNNIQKCIDHMHFMRFSTNQYVNQSEVSTYLFRLYNIKKEYANALFHIKTVINKPVINSEDLYRNKEAHELLSMFLLEENNRLVKKNKK